jgi:hypothetical protein
MSRWLREGDTTARGAWMQQDFATTSLAACSLFGSGVVPVSRSHRLLGGRDGVAEVAFWSRGMQPKGRETRESHGVCSLALTLYHHGS